MSNTAIAHGVEDIHTADVDFEENYRRVTNRYSRLKRLIQMRASEIVVRSERRMLKAAVDDLLDRAEAEDIISFVGTAIESPARMHPLAPCERRPQCDLKR